MEFLIKHWPILLLLLLPILAVAATFAIFRKAELSREHHRLFSVMTVIAVVFAVALCVYVLAAGGGLEIILPVLLLTLLILLI